MNKKVGFYYNCYKNKYATDNVLNILRQFYPNSPVFLMCDKGDDFTDIAQKYNCEYYYSNINILGGAMYNGRPYMGFRDSDCLKEYLKIVKIAIKYCKTEYLIFMEDDVIINGIITEFPEHSGGDINHNKFSNLISKEGIDYLNDKYPNIKFSYWNMAGGSIVNCNTILECIEKTNIEEILYFNKYCTYPFGLCHTNDVTLNFLLMINGKTNDFFTNTHKSNMRHPDKRFYNQNLKIEDGVHRK